MGPLHTGYYTGYSLAGDDLMEAVMTVEEAIAWSHTHPQCFGFTYASDVRNPDKPVRVWFKSKLNVLHKEGWWTYSIGRGMD